MTTRTASQSPRALELVGNYAFIYEASDIPPGITIGEFRSQRSENRHTRGLHAWVRRLLSRGQGGHPRDARPPALLVASPAQPMKGLAMTTTIEHEAALARIEEMRRYADATRRYRGPKRRRQSRRRPRAVLATAACWLRL